jgi:PEGA domain
MTPRSRLQLLARLASPTAVVFWQATGLAQPQPGDAGADPSNGPSPTLPADSGPPTPPQPLAETLSGQALQDYQAALLLHGSGDYQGARRSFSSAYELSGDVRLLWNAAACEQARRRYARAILLVRRYLASKSPLITAEAERNAREFLDAALPLTAPFRVESNLGAAVYVDDEIVGTLPLDPETRVDLGTHQLVLKKKGFVNAAKSFTVTSPKELVITLALQPELRRGRLVVRASNGDSISLDGRFVGLGRFDGPVSAGSHLLKVQAEGARPFESRVLVEHEHTRFLDVTLERKDGTTLPTWVWVTGGAALLAGAGTAGYFLFRPSDETESSAQTGSLGNVQLPLR